MIGSVLVLREDELSARDKESTNILVLRSNRISIFGERFDALLLSFRDLSSRILRLSARARNELKGASITVLVDRERSEVVRTDDRGSGNHLLGPLPGVILEQIISFTLPEWLR